jgi:SAM-dependent methyltransferase
MMTVTWERRGDEATGRAESGPPSPDLFQAWRECRDGFPPLFLEPVMAPALAHLAGALRPDALVLDLGSGNGHVAHAVRACGARTICLEIDPAVLRASRGRYPGGAHLAADATRIPLADGSVDAVYCFSVLQYLERDVALAEMRRVLRPGGRVVVVENLAGSPVALFYRAWRAVTGVRYPKRLTPLRRVSWRDRHRFLTLFPGARIEAFFLLSTWLLLIPAVYHSDASEPSDSLVHALLGATRRLDSWLLRAFPWLGHAAWMLLIRG